MRPALGSITAPRHLSRVLLPEPEGPIRLIQPKVRYRFEDPALQSLSAGHKIMVRIGVENARKIKAKLRDIRQRLTSAGGAR